MCSLTFWGPYAIIAAEGVPAGIRRRRSYRPTKQPMTSPTSTVRTRPLPRWLLLLIGIVLVSALLALLFFVLRRVAPQPEPVLRIAPAAAALDDAATVAVTGSGWQPKEDVAICLNAPDDAACDEANALMVDAADGDGNLDLLLEASAYLAQGRTIFLARGLDSGQQASRAFRVLRPAEGSSVVAAGATATPEADEADLTPIAAGQATDEPLAQESDVWTAEYFTNPDLAGQPALVRSEVDPNLDWGEESPAPGIVPADGFSVRWSRTVEFMPGLYRFVLTSDDGGRLRIEGETVIDAWQDAAGQTRTADQALSGGQYQVVVEHRDLAGPARSLFGWTPLTMPTPGQIAGVDFTATPAVASTTAPTATPEALPTAVPTTEPFIPPGGATNTPEATSPAATETPTPTSSFTASPTPTDGTPPGTATPESTPGTATATPTATAPPSGTPLMTPASGYRFIELNPSVGRPGQEITVASGNWSPGTVLRVSLGEFNTGYTQAQLLPGVSFTTPIDSSQAWSFRFVFPDQPPWSTQTRPVEVWVHNATWSEWGHDKFDFDMPQ